MEIQRKRKLYENVEENENQEQNEIKYEEESENK